MLAVKGEPKWHANRARKNLWEKPGILAAQSLSPSTSLNLPSKSSSQIIHRRFIHILNKKNISNYIQPFLIWMRIMRGCKVAKRFLPNDFFWLRNRQLHCFHSYAYKTVLGRRLTPPALKSSKVSRPRTGLSRGTLVTLPVSLQLPVLVLLLLLLHVSQPGLSLPPGVQ